MVAFKSFFALILMTFSFLLIGGASHSNQERTPALFDTKAEAEKVAGKFNCKGAHKMGNKWMPCQSHEDHKENKKESGHGHQHHH